MTDELQIAETGINLPKTLSVTIAVAYVFLENNSDDAVAESLFIGLEIVLARRRTTWSAYGVAVSRSNRKKCT